MKTSWEGYTDFRRLWKVICRFNAACELLFHAVERWFLETHGNLKHYARRKIKLN
jgi:hypothetical protein